jgi:hypothetical protein
MPGGDRTGPQGQGPMTGRGMGPCGGRRTGSRQPVGGGMRPRRGFSRGRGLGRRIAGGLSSMRQRMRGAGPGRGRGRSMGE